MNEEKYQRILNTIIEKAPIETGVQTLVFMLLDEIESENNKNRKKEEKVSILVADLRKGKNPIFGGDAGIVDLCVVNKDFTYVEQNSKELEKMKKNRIGCVEVKATSIPIPESGKIDQIIGHILTFRKVICTNGLVWKYYFPSSNYLDEIEKIYIDYKKTEEELDKKKKELRRKCRFIGKKWITPNMVEENIHNPIYGKDGQELLNKIGTLYILRDEYYKRMVKWLEDIPQKDKWEVLIANISITHTTNREKIVIDKKKFIELIDKLKAINWK